MYDPKDISVADAQALQARARRYVDRHGSPYGEKPLSDVDREDVAAQIVADWFSADWEALQWEYTSKTGRALFNATLSALGMHLRALLYIAGRSRRRNWKPEDWKGARVAERRRDGAEYSGASADARALRPDAILAAVETATGALLLSPAAAQARSRAGLPLRQRGGLQCIPKRFAEKRLRVQKRRNGSRVVCHVLERQPTRTLVRFERAIHYRFERVGTIPNREMPRSVKRPPQGFEAPQAREALQG